MQYTSKDNQTIGQSANIVDIMDTMLANQKSTPESDINYCSYKIDYLERECQGCNLCNYGRDCHNNAIS